MSSEYPHKGNDSLPQLSGREGRESIEKGSMSLIASQEGHNEKDIFVDNTKK